MKTLAIHLGRMVLLVLLAAIASALLMRYSPGALVDERELDPRLGPDTLNALRAKRAAQNRVSAGLVQYFRSAVHGDLGESVSRNAPIAGLIRQNTPATVRRLVLGLSGAWMVGCGAAVLVAALQRVWILDAASGILAGALLSVPAGVLAYLALTANVQIEFVLILVLLPRVFRFSRNLLVQAYGATHVEMARARGIPEIRILFKCVLASAGPQLVALAAGSLSMAVGAIIPIEAICDAAGLGRLAWQAATSRDLLLLVNLTMLIALATTAVMAVSEMLTREQRAGAL